MSFPAVRMIAADLDGTLLDDNKRIAEVTRQAIRALKTQDIPFIIASARPPRSVRHIYADLQLDTPQINYNGALIWDEAHRRVIDHHPMDGALALEMIRFARKHDARTLVTCEILDRWHTDRLDNSFTTETGRLFEPDFIGPVEQFCCGPVTKLLLLGPPEVIVPLHDSIAAAFAGRAIVIRTDNELLQITAPDVSKAAALRRIADHYRIPLAHTLAIGDAENDIEMLRECGIGVAVSNAAPRVKQVAHYVAARANSEGVYEAISRFVLGVPAARL